MTDIEGLGTAFSRSRRTPPPRSSPAITAHRVRPRPTSTAAPQSVPQPHSSVERALRQALRLIDGALAEHRGAAGERPIVELPESEAVTTAVRTLVFEARRELVCVAPAESMDAGPFEPVTDLLRQPSRPGAPRLRVLIPARDPQARRRLRDLVPEAGTDETRVTETALQEMVLADRRTAVVVSRLGPTTRQALAVTNPALVSALYGLFADSWKTAAPLRPVPLLDDPRQRETASQVLAALREGRKDDVAARELGMSVRTYRRYVADFMRELDATSRFQAGVRAAELRLLPPEGSG
jgi:hypothetical protein